MTSFTPKRTAGHPNGPQLPTPGPFHILCLSGGGYLSYYTALVLAGLEKRMGGPIRTRFDLIAGTSAGGILAMAVAMGVPMHSFAQMFKEHGATLFSTNTPIKTRRAIARDFLKHMWSARYASADLEAVLAQFIPEDFLIKDLNKRLLIPAYNMTRAAPRSLRTHHLPDQSNAGSWRARDVCMATSAAPLFFPLHKTEDGLYADGAFYANSPDTIALHEAGMLHVPDKDIWMLSIGTASQHNSANPDGKLSWGMRDWTKEQLIIKAVMNSQQLASQRQVKQRLKNQYMRLDGKAPPDMAKIIGLDIATPEAQDILEGLARSTLSSLDWKIAAFFSHRAKPAILGPGNTSLDPWDDID